MKKLLLSAFAAFACVATNAAEATFDFTGTGDVYGLTRTTDNNAEYYQTGATITSDGVTIGILGSGDASGEYGNGIRLWSDGLRVMKKSGLTISAGTDNITAITVTTTKNNGPASFDVNTTESFTLDASDKKIGTWEGGVTPVTLINNADKGLKGTVCITKITITYGGQADTRKDAGLAFSEEKVTIEMGDPFTAPTLTKATTADVTYASDKTSVATVDASTGAVTIVGVGSARITASAAANEEYKAGSASYLITVNEKIIIPDNSIFYSHLGDGFSFDNPEGLEIWKANNYGLVGSGFINQAPNAAIAVVYTTDFIDLTAVKDITLTFQNAFNQYRLNNVLIPVADFKDYAYIVARAEGETAWTVVTEPTAPAAFSWDFYDNAPVSLEAFKGKKIQLGFRYHSTADVAGTWEVKAINISAISDSSAIDAIETETTEAPVEYFNLQGQPVANPANGLFIKRQGNKVEKVIVK